MTKLQEKIAGLIRKGKGTSEIASEAKTSKTYVRIMRKRASVSKSRAPVRAMTAIKSLVAVKGRVAAIKAVTENGHLSIAAIEAKAVEHLRKAEDLKRAAAALRAEGFSS